MENLGYFCLQNKIKENFENEDKNNNNLSSFKKMKTWIKKYRLIIHFD